MRWRACLVIFTFILVTTATAPLLAGDPTEAIALSVSVPDGCPGADELRRRLATRLGEAALAPSRVAVTILPTDDRARFSLAIEIEIGIETSEDAVRANADPRRLDGSSCEELLSAAALILSIALVPVDDDAKEGASTNSQNEIDDADERSRPFTRERIEAPVERAPVVVRLGAVTAIDAGTLPRVAPGIGFIGALVNRTLRFDLAAVYFPKQRSIADATRMAGGDFSALTAAARACLGPSPVAICGGGEWSLVTATGVGTETTETETFYMWGLTMGARWEMRLGERVMVAAAGELVARPQRPAFRIANPDRIVHRPGWLSARLWLQGEVALF